MNYIFLAECFEELEMTTVLDVLRRAEVDVQTVSITGERLVRGSHGMAVEADVLFDAVPREDFLHADALILPGGMPGADNLKRFQPLLDLLREADATTLRAAICAAPMVLAAAGVLDGKTATCYPSFEKHFPATATYDGEQYVVRDGNVITGAGPAAAIEFACTLVATEHGEDAVGHVLDGMLF